MLKRRPELVAELAATIYRDRRGEVPEGKHPWWQLPIFNFYEDYLTVSAGGTYIRSAQRFEQLPRHTAALKEGLTLFADLCNELSYDMEFLQGDVQILHNHVTAHSRSEFEDYPRARAQAQSAAPVARHTRRTAAAAGVQRPFRPPEGRGTAGWGRRGAGNRVQGAFVSGVGSPGFVIRRGNSHVTPPHSVFCTIIPAPITRHGHGPALVIPSPAPVTPAPGPVTPAPTPVTPAPTSCHPGLDPGSSGGGGVRRSSGRLRFWIPGQARDDGEGVRDGGGRPGMTERARSDKGVGVRIPNQVRNRDGRG